MLQLESILLVLDLSLSKNPIKERSQSALSLVHAHLSNLVFIELFLVARPGDLICQGLGMSINKVLLT